MTRDVVLKLSPHAVHQIEDFTYHLSKALNLPTQNIKGYRMVRKALDARKKPIKYHIKFLVYVNEPPGDGEPKMIYHKARPTHKVHIIGSGPAGLFAALELLKEGFMPVVFERGKDVRSRKVDIANIHRSHNLNKESNYSYGEGGAGTFSDGKLFTRSKKRGSVDDVLHTFIKHGAPSHIMYDAQPHIGSDILPRIVENMRKTILANGGEIHFNSKLTGFNITEGVIKSIYINSSREVPVTNLILATGHSARDIYHLLDRHKIKMEPKAFAAGLRVEHPQELINQIQYHGAGYPPELPPASYKLITQQNGRGVFSFCMCPGGYIVPSATDTEEMVVNGMSNAKRNAPYANAGIVVQVSPEDVFKDRPLNPIDFLNFQKKLEKDFCMSKQKPLTAPAQRLTDFINGRCSTNLPKNSYHPGVSSVLLEELLPSFISRPLKQAFVAFDKKMKGFVTDEAVLLGVESRTSSPICIQRDKERFHHVQITNLYPCGEGAGYAGGITSSAIDGINTARVIIKTALFKNGL